MHPGKYQSVVKAIPSGKSFSCPKSLLNVIEYFGVPWALPAAS